MVRFKWPYDKILFQRAILLSIIGMISCAIVKGHMNYEREVAEYMQSLEYRQAKEASKEYTAMKLKTKQELTVSEDASSSSND